MTNVVPPGDRQRGARSFRDAGRPLHPGWTLGTLLVCAGLLTATAGCGDRGDELPREPVSGTVTLDGQPLERGSIRFTPTSPDIATSGGGVISDGRFAIARHQGLVPGTYKVMIFSQGEDTPLPEGHIPGAPMPLPQELIPPRYNTASTLTAEVQERGDNRFDFALER